LYIVGVIKTAERKLADRTLCRGGQGPMAWVVSNAHVEPRGDAIIITKEASGTAKIDPLMAAFNDIAWMAPNPTSARLRIFVI
jgi:phage terminase large subunit-like protein